MACGTLPAEQQKQVDTEQWQHLRTLTTEAATGADSIFVGTVTALERPARNPLRRGHVTLSVSNTLKGAAAQSRTLEWDEVFILSCDAADAFRNVGFRPDGAYIVYVQAGRVIRSDAADELRDSSLLKLSDEVLLVAAQQHH